MKSYATTQHFQFKNPIIKAHLHESLFYIIDCKNILYVMTKDCKQKLQIKLLNSDQELHYYAHNYSLAEGIISIPKANSVLCAKYKDDKVSVMSKNEYVGKDIIYTAFNNNAKMLLSCSMDGKASILHTHSKFHCYTFENQSDYCSSAFFSNKDIFVYIGYFNLKNKILNLKDFTLVEFKVKNPIEAGTFFDNDTKLFLADRAGNSMIYDCIDNEFISTKALFTEWVSCLVLYSEKYILLGTRKNKLYIIDAFENELIATIELDSHGITSMTIKDGELLISYADSNFETINLNYLKQNFILHLNLQEYDEAKQILDQNLFLYIDESIKKFEAGFDKILAKAMELISHGKIDDALQAASPFLSYKKFKNQLELLFMQQDYIGSFIEAAEKNDIQSAYALAEKYHVIPTLGTYQVLEKQWEKTFALAKKAIEIDSLHGKNNAKAILEVYSKVAQKSETIKQLLNNSKMFVLADKLVKQQDFVNYFAMTKRFTFLQDTLLYKKMDVLAFSLKGKALQASTQNNIEEAKKIYSQLVVFPEYAVYARKNIQEIDTKIKLDSLIEAKDMTIIYDYVLKYHYLAYYDVFLKYHLYFERDFQNAQLSIEKNDTAAAIKTLSKYFPIRYLDKKIANLFKLVYLREIENSNLKECDTTRIILIYKKLFGLDNEIKDIFINNQMEKEFRYALKSIAQVIVHKYPKSIFSV